MDFFRLTAGVLGVLIMLAVNFAPAARNGVAAAERGRLPELTAAKAAHATAPVSPALRDLDSDDDEIKAQRRLRANQAVALPQSFAGSAREPAEFLARRWTQPGSQFRPRRTLVGVIELRI